MRHLLKKIGLELNFANYRPVSNLSFLYKVIEKSVLLRLNVHIDSNDLLSKNQSAYRRFHSCESALLRLVNDLLNGMENQEVSALIAIDCARSTMTYLLTSFIDNMMIDMRTKYAVMVYMV